MAQTIIRDSRRRTDKLATVGGCLRHAFPPECTDTFDQLLAAIDAAERGQKAASQCADGGLLDALARLRSLGLTEITTPLSEPGPTLIWPDQMMPLMLTACPSFQEHWDTFWKAEEEDRPESEPDVLRALPLYFVMQDLARHVARKLDSGQTSEMAALFAVVERWIVEGSETVKMVAISGFLHELLLPHIYLLTNPKHLLTWAGPRTYKWWVESAGFWDRLASGQVRRN